MKIKERLETVIVSKQICSIQILCSSVILSSAGSLFLKSERQKINYSRPECEKEFSIILESELYLIMRPK